MTFVDHAQVTVNAGDGGRGCTAFAQPPYSRYPYPDGGDGGDGGDVILRADPHLATLLDFQFRHEFAAGRGDHGGSNRKTGRGGTDLVIRVPVGTVVRDAKTLHTLRDLVRPGDEVIVARGGRGGLGNATTPRGQRRKRAATPGTPGERRQLVLELKLIADVGLIGLPNAGKSSLLSRISTARPKIGAYPFTTRYPVLGVVRLRGREPFVACDIPGLIEGAHAGRGLGIEFLRHIERTKVLVHLIDMAGVDGQDPLAAHRQVNRELAAYSRTLAAKPQLLVANKMDLPEAQGHLQAFERRLKNPAGRVWPISCATGQGIPALLEGMWDALQSA